MHTTTINYRSITRRTVRVASEACTYHVYTLSQHIGKLWMTLEYWTPVVGQVVGKYPHIVTASSIAPQPKRWTYEDYKAAGWVGITARAAFKRITGITPQRMYYRAHCRY